MKPFLDKMTIGDKYHPAMKITDEAEAAEYFAACVEHSMRHGYSREDAERIERSNLAYFAGYYDDETRLQVERVFKCAHPIFGSARDGVPTAEEAFKMGRELGAAARLREAISAHITTVDELFAHPVEGQARIQRGMDLAATINDLRAVLKETADA